MNNTMFFAIIVASVVSYLLKIIPLLVGRKLNIGNNRLTTVLDYASCCIMGEIIYSAGFRNVTFQKLIAGNLLLDSINIIFILLSFIICFKSGSIMKSIAITLPIYSIIIVLVNHL